MTQVLRSGNFDVFDVFNVSLLYVYSMLGLKFLIFAILFASVLSFTPRTVPLGRNKDARDRNVLARQQKSIPISSRTYVFLCFCVFSTFMSLFCVCFVF